MGFCKIFISVKTHFNMGVIEAGFTVAAGQFQNYPHCMGVVTFERIKQQNKEEER